MSVGNWRDHILVNCARCSKPMGHHVETVTAVCDECDKSKQVRIYMEETRYRLKTEGARNEQN